MDEWRQLYQLLSPLSRRRLWLLLVLMLLGSFSEMISLGAIVPFLTLLVSPEASANLPFVGSWLARQPHEQIIPVVGSFFLLALLIATLMRIWLLHASNQFAQMTGYELSIKAFRTLLAQPYLWHVQHNSSYQITQLNRINELVFRSIQPVLLLITSSVLGLGILVMLFASEPLIMSLMALFVTVFYATTLLLVRRTLNANGALMNTAQVTKVRILQESLGGIRDVILDHSQAVRASGFAHVELKVRRAIILNEWIGQLPRYLIEFFGIVTIVGLALAFNRSGSGSIATLGLLALGSQRLLPLAQKVYESINQLRVAGAARSDVVRLLALPDKLQPKPQLPLSFKHCLALEDISFRYPTSSGWVLRNLNLTIRKGERIGIVGASGSGKSTLMDLMMGLLEPTEGNLTVDGTVLTAENLPAWRQRIAHVPQSIFLLDASLKENIALGVPTESIDEARLATCIAQAQLSDVVSKLPQGTDTLIGERGVLLSGGQRQRIGIARALYREADVLVMDEATSALDNQTESEVMKAIQLLGPQITIVMIAHRLASLSFCEKLFIFDSECGFVLKNNPDSNYGLT